MSIKTAYDHMTSEREGFLCQAREQSKLTIPSLIPPDGTTSSYADLYKPYQSTGSLGVTSLANKLTGALYPSNEPFFVFEPRSDVEGFDQLDGEQISLIELTLSNIEQRVLTLFTQRGDRAAINEAMKHLLVGGNVLIHVGEEVSRFYGLDNFVAARDGSGTLLKTITKDVLSYETFRESFPDLTAVHAAHKGNRSYYPSTIEVYTEMCRRDGRWEVTQEASGQRMSKDTYPLDTPPYIALRFNRIDGQSYGRGYVENIYGDLSSLEGLRKSLVEGAAISARVVHLVNPNGLLNQREFEKAPNGAVLAGSDGDVSTVQTNKATDLSIAGNEAARLESKLDQAFMRVGAAQRDAERVTATEVRTVANEVEQVLGGVYAVLSEEFQRPYVRRLLALFKKKGLIPEFRDDLVDVNVVTGLSAIGRGIDRERLIAFLTALSQAFGQEAMQRFANVDVGIYQLAASFGININGLIKSPEQIAQEEQQAQQTQLAGQLGPSAIQAAGRVAQSQVEGTQDAGTDQTQNSPQA